MKPVNLHMINIGPYRDETIDFSALDNMFLIKGDTGAGKTFIFDAITFALYGSLRGNRKGHESDFKSRYAKEEDESLVEFKFDVNGRRYFISRSVPFAYLNRNGKTSKKLSDVYFYEETKDGKKEIPGKLSEINDKIKDIIGLSVDDFAQIILLPQGQFAEFLHQNSKDKADTLKTLFPVNFYTEITAQVKNEYLEKNKKLELLNIQLEKAGNERDFSNAEEVIKNNDIEIEKLETEEKTVNESLIKIAAETEKLNNQYSASVKFEENQNALFELQKQENDFKLLLEKINRAGKSLELKEYISSFEKETENKTLAESNLKKAEKEKNTAQEDFEKQNSKEEEMKSLSRKNQDDDSTLKLLNSKIEDVKDLPLLQEKEKENTYYIEENKNKIAELAEKIETEKAFLNGKSALELSAAINEKFTDLQNRQSELLLEKESIQKRDNLLKDIKKAEKEINEKKEKLDSEKQKLERIQKTIEGLKEENERQKLNHSAYIVSLSLKPGSPCPVCGSKEHPLVAQKPAGLLDYEEQIKTNTGSLESIKDLVSRLERDIAVSNKEIEERNTSLSEIKSEKTLEEAEKDLKDVKDAISETEINRNELISRSKKITENEKKLQKQKDDISEREKELAGIKAERETLEKNLGEPLEAVIQKRDKLKIELENNAAAFNTWQKLFDEAKTKYEKVKVKLEECIKNAETAKSKFNDAQKTVDEKISSSIFVSIEEAKSAFIATEEIERLRTKYNDYYKRLASLQDIVKAGKNENLEPSSVISGKINQIKKKQEDEAGHLSAAKSELENKKTENTRYKDAFTEFKKNEEQFSRLEKEIKPLHKLYDDLSGNNAQRLNFETWALSMYFEQVVSFASRRFFDISGGRFSFEFKNEKASGNKNSGLELKVFDSYSGKYSDPAELSGGETFEASLSLALALTDVVQNSNGGIQLDSLFIDEGFGTLDPETLEKAMSVLFDLSENKMIGIISHVSEMEDFPEIKSFIKVNKTNQGSAIECKTF